MSLPFDINFGVDGLMDKMSTAAACLVIIEWSCMQNLNEMIFTRLFIIHFWWVSTRSASSICLLACLLGMGMFDFLFPFLFFFFPDVLLHKQSQYIVHEAYSIPNNLLATSMSVKWKLTRMRHIHKIWFNKHLQRFFLVVYIVTYI